MSNLFERLIEVRGVTTDFLDPQYEKLADPFLLPDMEAAVERILTARDNGEKVLIYGDYDVDGVTASTVMEETLRLVGIQEIGIMLPDRFADGYGMSPKVVKRAREQGIGLVMTVDCGSGNKAIIEELTTLGIDTVVTDHHECPEELPAAVAVVNPKRKEFAGFRDLAGVGVAFKVAQALVTKGAIKAGQEKWLLDLVIIGTICDAMPLLDENRILGVFGMKVLSKTRRVGLVELMRKAGVKKINSEAIGFQIGPRLNAAGRLESAELALNLVRAKTRAEAARLADQLEQLNQQRKTEQRAAVAEIAARGVSDDAVLIEVGKWHEGILGIVAGKLVEDYHRPAFVLSEVVDGMLKGSGRSFGDFSLANALDACRETIVSGGGHAGACGVRVETERLWEFREKINHYYDELKLCDQECYLCQHGDLVVSDFQDLSLDFLEELKRLEPFGEGNAEPIFSLENVEVIGVKQMGSEGQHLALAVTDQTGKGLKLVKFFAPEEWFKIGVGERVNILMQIMENEWNGTRSVEGRILALSDILEV